MVKGSFSSNSRRTEDERPSEYPQKLTTQRQKSFESHLSSTLMRVKLVNLIVNGPVFSSDVQLQFSA